MNYLQYTSKEMFSSTELIRKSKMIFEKLSNEEIEKAIILRDGKPSFMLLDFAKYEELMSEYLMLKENAQSKAQTKIQQEPKTTKKIETIQDEIEIIEEKIETINETEIADEELEKALAEIEQLDLSLEKSDDDVVEEITNIEENTEEKEKQPLKDFWE